ncbi:hypothetical protein, partial [Stenotrophomonas maltophilia]|uniref:hypothetical protein n=1 Tax=Stenotrophomonas maltophilia TaxID=40324 RepID=UPI001954FDED
AYTPKWGLDVPVEPEVAANVEAAVDTLRRAGLTLVARDPVWPAGVAETGLNPIQQSGLAALYGEAWRRAPDQIDPDLGAQISS